MKKNIAQRVEELVLPMTEEMGYELVDVEYVKEAGMYFLRVIIDADGGFSLDQCEVISKKLSPILDEKDFIEENYFLEVCSPGIDRVLKRDKEFEKYSGKEVELKLYKVDEKINSKHFEAVLIGLTENDEVKLEYNSEVIILNRKDIAQIRLAVKF